MKIRTITAGIELDPDDMEAQVEEAAGFLHSARERFADAAIEVQTVRLSTQRWETYSLDRMPFGIVDAIRELEEVVRRNGIDFLSVGPATNPASIGIVPSILESTSACCSSMIADSRGVLENNIGPTVSAILDISRIASNGSKNFMFSALANCPPGTPFFPAAYHEDKGPSFSIGLESGDLVYQAAGRSGNLKEFTSFLAHIYGERLAELEKISSSLGGGFGFLGIDLSYAPGLEERSSIALAVERITGSRFGSQGTLSACAAITSSLDGQKVRRCGYSGLMLPVLEDVGLGSGADIGAFDTQKLLLYSSVCGTGIDAVPVPGDARIEDCIDTARRCIHVP